MEYSLRFRAPRKEIRRFVRFAIVGMTGTLVDFGVLVVLKELGQLPVLLANTLSYTAGITNNFTLNRLWTYPDARGKWVWTQLGQFFAISAMGLLFNDGIVWLLGEPLGLLINRPQMSYIAAKVVATLSVITWNFFVNRYWTFNDAR